jgi:hypothetical protein
MESLQKPRLLYFNGPWNHLGERLVTSCVMPFRRLLDQDFEVISVEGDCNLSDEVEKHRPDAILFHPGTGSNKQKEVTIARADSYREIPRMGYMDQDLINPAYIPPMNRWGVDQIFTRNRASVLPPAFSKDSFHLPSWIDASIYRDYGESKTYPIVLAGAGWLLTDPSVPWRHAIFAQLVMRFPIFHVPAAQNRKSPDVFVGADYARLLNRSLCAPRCGSVNQFLTSELLEIPASRCCLITQESEELKAAGFIDTVNCIFADEKSVVQKLQMLLDEPARLQAITDAGYELVHRRHTKNQRRMLIEWFRLWRSRVPGQQIIQANPLDSLQLTSSVASVPAES